MVLKMVVGTTGIYILLSAILGIELAQSFGLRYLIRIDERTYNIQEAIIAQTTKIESGTVIDHIPKGKGKEIAEKLGLYELGESFRMISHIPSDKMEEKDVIKVENKKLSEDKWEEIKEITEKATINIIENWKVKKKVRLSDF